MKHRPYHLTKTGIRIPRHKIKWMPPLTKSDNDKPARSQHPEIDVPINLCYIDKLFITPPGRNLLDCGETIVVDDWKECGNDDK